MAELPNFMRAVPPVAEEWGARLALHPNDPLVPSLGRVAQIFRSWDSFRRVLETFPGNFLGLDFCQGTWAEMEDVDLLAAIRYFARRGKALYLHFRNVGRSVPSFVGTFVGADQVGMLAALRVYRECGFPGFFADDHVPEVAEGSERGHRSRALAAGYVRALLAAIMRGRASGHFLAGRTEQAAQTTAIRSPYRLPK